MMYILLVLENGLVICDEVIRVKQAVCGVHNYLQLLIILIVVGQIGIVQQLSVIIMDIFGEGMEMDLYTDHIWWYGIVENGIQYLFVDIKHIFLFLLFELFFMKNYIVSVVLVLFICIPVYAESVSTGSSSIPAMTMPSPPSSEELGTINAASTRIATWSGTDADQELLKKYDVKIQYQWVPFQQKNESISIPPKETMPQSQEITKIAATSSTIDIKNKENSSGTILYISIVLILISIVLFGIVSLLLRKLSVLSIKKEEL